MSLVMHCVKCGKTTIWKDAGSEDLEDRIIKSYQCESCDSTVREVELKEEGAPPRPERRKRVK